MSYPTRPLLPIVKSKPQLSSITIYVKLWTRIWHVPFCLNYSSLLKSFSIFSLTDEHHLAKAEPWFPLFFHEINIGILYAYVTLSPPSTRIIVQNNNSSVPLLLWNYKQGTDILALFALNTVFTQVISNSSFTLRDVI